MHQLNLERPSTLPRRSKTAHPKFCGRPALQGNEIPRRIAFLRQELPSSARSCHCHTCLCTSSFLPRAAQRAGVHPTTGLRSLQAREASNSCNWCSLLSVPASWASCCASVLFPRCQGRRASGHQLLQILRFRTFCGYQILHAANFPPSEFLGRNSDLGVFLWPTPPSHPFSPTF